MTTPDPLDRGLLDRTSGVLLIQACGDALGVPYEFAMPPGPGEDAVMRGGGLGPYEPGEWSDDTQMAICIARVSAEASLDPAAPGSEKALDDVAAAFEAWRTGGASDVGTQTAAVLRDAGHLSGSPATRLRQASEALHAQTGRTAGNGALMRTGVVGLVALDDREATARAARSVAELTHTDQLAGDSCVLWSEAVRVAVTEERLDVRAGLDLLPPGSRAQWAEWIADAEQAQPAADLRSNGFTVTAFQAAWHAIFRTAPSDANVPDRALRTGTQHVVAALQAAVRIGGDTDTVAAIAGALLGARYGTVAPSDWQKSVRGWPGMRTIDLTALGRLTAQRGLVAGAAAEEGQPMSQVCPVCGTRGNVVPRYPGYVCAWCAAWASDEAGRRVVLVNTSFSGGYDAQYEDGSPASPAARQGRVWIKRVAYEAGEARFGGIVIRRPAGRHAG